MTRTIVQPASAVPAREAIEPVVHYSGHVTYIYAFDVAYELDARAAGDAAGPAGGAVPDGCE